MSNSYTDRIINVELRRKVQEVIHVFVISHDNNINTL